MPEKDHLARLRDSIDRHPSRWRRALNNADFKRVFFPQIKASAPEDKVLDALAEKNKEYSLKKRPQVCYSPVLTLEGGFQLLVNLAY